MDALRSELLDERSHFRRKHAENLATRFWNSAAGQRLRFRAALKYASGAILDVGCGDGAFLRCAAENGRPPAAYYGLDLVPEFLDEAEEVRKELGITGRFYEWDAVERPWPAPEADWCVAVGLFWAAQKTRALWNLRFETITEAMWAHAGRGMLVTLTSACSSQRAPMAYYAEPQEALHTFMTLFGSYVVLDHSYLCNDFMLVAYKGAP